MAQERFVVRASEVERQQERHAHPCNPDSELPGTRLSSLVGLSRLGVTRAVIPPGKESFVYRSHHREEWIYVLSGRGVAVKTSRSTTSPTPGNSGRSGR